MTLPHVLISGPIGSGKTTLAQGLENYGYTRMSLANGVKEMAISLDPVVDYDQVSQAMIYLSDLNIRTVEQLNEIKRDHPEIRRTLQRLGTEVIREHVDDNWWIDALIRTAHRMPTFPNIAIDDMRFTNELDRLRWSLKGTVIHFHIDGPKEPIGDRHSSETDQENLMSMADHILHNNQTPADLILKAFKIIEGVVVGI